MKKGIHELYFLISKICMEFVLAVFNVNFTKAGVIRKEGISIEKMLRKV